MPTSVAASAPSECESRGSLRHGGHWNLQTHHAAGDRADAMPGRSNVAERLMSS